MTEAQKKARNKYQQKVKKLTLDFCPTEMDLLEHINKQDKKQTYIKDLIRADIEKHAADMVEVVRCKDCKYYTDLSPYDRGECSYYENLDLYCPERDGYCSCGVAKMDK